MCLTASTINQKSSITLVTGVCLVCPAVVLYCVQRLCKCITSTNQKGCHVLLWPPLTGLTNPPCETTTSQKKKKKKKKKEEKNKKQEVIKVSAFYIIPLTQEPYFL